MACLAVLSVMWVLPAQVYGQASDLLVSEIRVRGNELTEESLIRWSCGLNEGQPLVLPDDPARAIRNLHRMGMFADIQILVDQEAEEGVAVEIVVREHPKLGEVTFEGNKKISKKKLSITNAHPGSARKTARSGYPTSVTPGNTSSHRRVA